MFTHPAKGDTLPRLQCPPNHPAKGDTLSQVMMSAHYRPTKVNSLPTPCYTVPTNCPAIANRLPEASVYHPQQFRWGTHSKPGYSVPQQPTSVLFRNDWNVRTQSIFFLFQSISIISLYNPLFQCFETPDMGPGIFTFSRACFNFVSKQLKRLDLANFKIHCFNVSKHQKWGLVFSPFPDFVSILFRNVLKWLKRLDLANFLHVSVCFNNFPI